MLYPVKKFQGSTVEMFDSLLLSLLPHRDHSIAFTFTPNLTSRAVVCRDCENIILEGSVTLLEQVVDEFFRRTWIQK